MVEEANAGAEENRRDVDVELVEEAGIGIPASGRDVRWDAVDIYRVTDDGKISEQWAFEDMAAIGSQLGAFSLPGRTDHSNGRSDR